MCLSSPKARRYTGRSQRSRILQGRPHKAQDGPKHGRWEKWEKLAFLQGLRLFGRGKWKRIGDNIPTRTTIQVKTHAQMVLKRMDLGEDVFAELDSNLKTSKNRTTAQSKLHAKMVLNRMDHGEDPVEKLHGNLKTRKNSITVQGKACAKMVLRHLNRGEDVVARLHRDHRTPKPRLHFVSPVANTKVTNTKIANTKVANSRPGPIKARTLVGATTRLNLTPNDFEAAIVLLGMREEIVFSNDDSK